MDCSSLANRQVLSLISVYLAFSRRPIILELEFHWRYLDSHDPPKISMICQSSDKDLSVRKLNNATDDFAVIRWYLDNRLKTVRGVYY